ncbi:DCC1-like thiol-disulfide oxidoreductase family protein [Salinirubellus sp. GCM10025818]|jgi:predicted DCC family thiol-disulfide oxidoreductase YuxK|uniref:DCC1-like thiol-disulfide oxidoreductase family protein n=1 Tax=Salinirubellus TaxID=2162630 RepID=UPI0030D2CE7E
MVPKLVYDDTCHFCTWSAVFAVRRSDVQPVRLSNVQAGESRLDDEERERLPEDYGECAQLITEDAVYSCGAATEQSLVLTDTLPSELVAVLRQFDAYETVREKGYHLVSNNRGKIAPLIGMEPPVSKHVPAEDVHPERTG